MSDQKRFQFEDNFRPFSLHRVSILVPKIIERHPEVVPILDYIKTAKSDEVAAIMVAIKKRIDQFTDQATT